MTDYVEQTRAIAAHVRETLKARQGRPTTVGLCGSQGSGKSTMSVALRSLLKNEGLSVALLSLDDLYLSRAVRESLARKVHPLLRTRGVPGTHDILLARAIFDALNRPGAIGLPIFDKAADDRRPQSEWVQTQAPVDVILFEGWCVGATPEKDAALEEPVNMLECDEDPDGVWRRYVNGVLANEYQQLFRRIDMLILLAAPSFDVVYRWRLQQENELRRKVATERGDMSRLMSDRQLERFVSHYERLTRHILAEMPSRADIVVWLDEERRGRVEERNGIRQ